MLLAEASRLEREVKAHKSAIYRHREQLQSAAAQLAALRQRLKELGIGFEVTPAPKAEHLRR